MISYGAQLVEVIKGMIAEAGLDPNKPPTTWAQMAEYAKKLTVKAHRFSEMAKDKIAKAGGQALSLDTAAAAE